MTSAMDRPDERGSLKVVSTSERATGALGTVGVGLVVVAVGGTGVGSALQASIAKSAIAVAAGMSRRLIFNSYLLPGRWLRVGIGYYTLQ